MTFDHLPDRTASPTAQLLDELALYAHRPFDDEADPRPLPEPEKIQGALADIFDALVATLSDTRLEPDLEVLLWSVVNIFHRRIDRIDIGARAGLRFLDEAAQRLVGRIERAALFFLHPGECGPVIGRLAGHVGCAVAVDRLL